ncbi:MAG: hypothetical protein SPI83_06460 [Rothia sp. (in: high G+C Gram-positive bacteria)]|nr:hypothetical protein [Rothia sp. (in: high G+C Gram-positive bacteria)]
MKRPNLFCHSNGMELNLSHICSAMHTHRELKDSGMSNNLISAKRRRGELIRLTRGIYLKGDIARHCTDSDRAKAMAVALQKNRPTAVVSHQSAALLWGAPLLTLPPKVHLSLLGTNKSGHPQAVLHSHKVTECSLATDLGGVKVTNPLTTVVDCGKTMPLQESLAIVDFFLKHGNLKLDMVREELEQIVGRGSQKIRVVAHLMSPLSESPLESFARLRLYQGRIEQPIQQFEIMTPSGRLYRADFAWPHLKLLLEVDGLHKYYGAYRSTDAQLRNDTLRQRELELAGWTVLRATWGDLAQRPELLISRLRHLGVRKTSQ